MNTGSSKRKERWNRPSATLPVRWKLFSDKNTSGSIEPVQENNCHELERLQPSPLTVHSPFRASPSETKRRELGRLNTKRRVNRDSFALRSTKRRFKRNNTRAATFETGTRPVASVAPLWKWHEKTRAAGSPKSRALKSRALAYVVRCLCEL